MFLGVFANSETDPENEEDLKQNKIDIAADGKESRNDDKNRVSEKKNLDEESAKSVPKDPKVKQHNSDDSIESDLDSLVSLESSNKKDKIVVPPKPARALSRPLVDGDWPYQREDLVSIGQVSGLALDGKHLIVFHRADRVWNSR